MNAVPALLQKGRDSLDRREEAGDVLVENAKLRQQRDEAQIAGARIKRGDVGELRGEIDLRPIKGASIARP